MNLSSLPPPQASRNAENILPSLKFPSSNSLPTSIHTLLSQTDFGWNLFSEALDSSGGVFRYDSLDEIIAEKWGDGIVDLPTLVSPCIALNLRAGKSLFPRGTTAALYCGVPDPVTKEYPVIVLVEDGAIGGPPLVLWLPFDVFVGQLLGFIEPPNDERNFPVEYVEYANRLMDLNLAD